MQPNDQAGRQTRAAKVFYEQLAELAIKEPPIDLIGKQEERVLPVENLIQLQTEQIALGLLER